MTYRNKTYVAFDGDNDIHYYRTMQMWKQNDKTNFNFHNAHDINTARDTSLEETIKRRLRERMLNSKTFILLVGNNTKYLNKFVRWEIELAIKLELPIIVVNLPKYKGHEGKREIDMERCPALARDTLAVHVSFRSKIIQHAMENWPNLHYKYLKEGISSSYSYKDSFYNELGL